MIVPPDGALETYEKNKIQGLPPDGVIFLQISDRKIRTI